MILKLSNFPQIEDAPVEQKIGLIDELWEQVRRAQPNPDVHPKHSSILEERFKAVQEDPALALSPSEARAQLRK